MKKIIFVIAVLAVVALSTGCAGLSGKANLDMFNGTIKADAEANVCLLCGYVVPEDHPTSGWTRVTKKVTKKKVIPASAKNDLWGDYQPSAEDLNGN